MMGMMANKQTAESKTVELDSKLTKALREDSVDQTIVLEELRSLNDDVLDHSNTSFRARLERFLETTPLEVFLVILVIVDVVILLAMLLMDLNVLHLLLQDSEQSASNAVHLLVANCQGNDALSHYHGSNLVTASRYLKSDGCVWSPHNLTNNHTNIASDPASVSHSRRRRAAGPAKEGENETAVLLREIVHVLHLLSVAILAIMVVEVLLKILALGKKYFKGKLEVVDGIVIIISFTLDLYFIDGVSPGQEGVNNGATVLVILLLWRILRVFNALLVTAKKRLQFRIRVQKRMRKALEDKIEALEGDIHTKEIHVSNLIKLAARHNAPDFEVKACKPIVKQTKKVNTQAGLASMMQMSMGLLQGMNNIKTNDNQRNGGISSNLRNPPPAESAEDVSGVMKHAMKSAEDFNKPVDAMDVLPVPVMTAMAGQQSPQPSTSPQARKPSIAGAGVDFATAFATRRDDSTSSSIYCNGENSSTGATIPKSPTPLLAS